MSAFASVADSRAIEAEMPWEARNQPATLLQFLTATAARYPDRPAVSFQLTSGPRDPAQTLTWSQLAARTAQAANLFRRLGVGETDVIAFLLPNALETVATLLGGAIAGVVSPINPLLEPEQIGAILRESGAQVLVTLKSFPQTDVAQKAAEAVRHAPNVRTVLELDLNRYLKAPKSWIVPLMRPKTEVHHTARILPLCAEMDREPTTFAHADAAGDRIAAIFHTGGTTGMPKLARHRYSGMIYNGWLGHHIIFRETDVMICPLPLFHVFAAYPILMSAIASGAHVVFPTPAGYRGAGVFDNFWKLIERWQVTFLITVPTALSALMQRPVDADVSSLKTAISGSAPLPVELYIRFEKATGVQVSEGYGLTEATCLVSCNPIVGQRKVGSVGIPFPYTHVRILARRPDGSVGAECGPDEVGEICVKNPGVWPNESAQPEIYLDDGWLRTGDLGRLDPDGYLWITGRAKDLIIRGGHNIDPAVIEEALMAHPAVAFVGAIGQPDSHAGEIPCAYVELVEGATVPAAELATFARTRVTERAAQPRHVEILPSLPKTAVGKILKNELRKRAIARIYDAALAEAATGVTVAEVIEDRRRGLVARLTRPEGTDEARVKKVLGAYTLPWEWV